MQLPGTDKRIMNFLGREIKEKRRSLQTMMHFILAKMSIVYLLLFSFTLKNWNIPLFPDVALRSCLTHLWWTGDVGLGHQRKRSQRQLPLHFQPMSLLKKKQQAGIAWGQCHPLQTIRHKKTKTLSWGPWFIPPSTGSPCFQPLPVSGSTRPGLKV